MPATPRVPRLFRRNRTAGDAIDRQEPSHPIDEPRHTADCTDDDRVRVTEARSSGAFDTAPHRAAYSDKRFWHKLTRVGRQTGREGARKALELYFVLKRPDVPVWAKSTIVGALGYFISPLDAIPDFIAGVGYTDDASVLAAALVAVSVYLDEDIKRRADEALSRWWPDPP
ncbi:YkvA family protein [Salinicola avicenniae]|uniref:YkvA family protein n=1 Tax=Salinicola avicenniae TaxID=2916836 RepID=UPI002072BD28|nr:MULTISPECIES: YkvA family protein [unclassified Salinicola]